MRLQEVKIAVMAETKELRQILWGVVGQTLGSQYLGQSLILGLEVGIEERVITG